MCWLTKLLNHYDTTNPSSHAKFIYYGRFRLAIHFGVYAGFPLSSDISCSDAWIGGTSYFTRRSTYFFASSPLSVAGTLWILSSHCNDPSPSLNFLTPILYLVNVTSKYGVLSPVRVVSTDHLPVQSSFASPSNSIDSSCEVSPLTVIINLVYSPSILTRSLCFWFLVTSIFACPFVWIVWIRLWRCAFFPRSDFAFGRRLPVPPKTTLLEIGSDCVPLSFIGHQSDSSSETNTGA